MNKSIFDKWDRIFNFFESAKGMFLLGIAISFVFVAYAISNPVGVLPPGIYYFGVLGSASLLFWSASLQPNKTAKFATVALGVLLIVWAITNTFLRS